MRSGDLLGSGTISGPTREETACLLEATRDGVEPLEIKSDQGKLTRAFLEDGDTVAFYARTDDRKGTVGRVGFGRCAGTVLPSS